MTDKYTLFCADVSKSGWSRTLMRSIGYAVQQITDTTTTDNDIQRVVEILCKYKADGLTLVVNSVFHTFLSETATFDDFKKTMLKINTESDAKLGGITMTNRTELYIFFTKLRQAFKEKLRLKKTNTPVFTTLQSLETRLEELRKSEGGRRKTRSKRSKYSKTRKNAHLILTTAT
jgi:CRISPR/Cas system-associated endoribonuclease Cas2